MINLNEVFETNKMIHEMNLDVRTITIGISLLDCVGATLEEVKENIYNKITTVAKDLVKTGKDIENEFGIPIVNKRISITPISLVGGNVCKTPDDFVELAKVLDAAAKKVGVNFLGGYSALVSKGMTKADELLIRSIPKALAETDFVCSSVNVGSTKTGINMDAVKLIGEIIKETAELTKDKDCLGAAKLVVFCNSPGDNPFMAGAFCGVGEPECALNVGVSGPGVVRAAVDALDKNASLSELANKIKQIAYKITSTGELIGRKLAQRLEIPFGVIDLSLAPTPDEGDSVAGIFQAMGLEHAGAHGTTAALAMLNDAVKKGGIMASSHVGGLSGAFIPVSEDAGMIEAAEKGYLTFDKLEAMTSVCSVGLDMIAIPGDTPVDTIAGMIADEMAIGMINKKTTAVRLIPVLGKKIGEEVVFGGLLGKAPIMPVNTLSSTGFVRRGGRIPAPIHSLNN